MSEVYSYLTRKMMPAAKARSRPDEPVDKTRKTVDNSGAMEAAAKMVEDLQGEVTALEERLRAQTEAVARLENELAIMTTERRQAESNYLQAAVDLGAAKATQAGLESALRNADAMNARLAAMKPPSPSPSKPTATPSPWKMEVHRDGAGNIREIIATPGK